MNTNVKQFITDVRALNINLRLSPDKSFVIYEPPLPSNMIQLAIDMADDICIVLDNESILLSEEDATLINGLIDPQNTTEYTSFKLTDNRPAEPKLPIVYEEMTEESFDRDFDFIRNNIKDIVNKGTLALDRMLMVAQESNHPRAYEVVATLMKTIADMNKDLLDSHKKRIDTKLVSGSPVTNTTNVQNNNSIFVGSTSELSKMLKSMNTKDAN